MMRRFNLYLFCLSSICLLSIAKAEAGNSLTAKALSHYIQAGIYERLNQLDESVREYKSALKADYNSPHLHLRLAVALVKQNQLLQAAKELSLAIRYYESESPPSNQEASFIEAHTLLALVYFLQGRSKEATDEYEIALRGVLAVEPENIRIHKSLGRVYLQKKKFSDAEKTYRFILNLAPSDFEAHFFLGNIYEQQGKIDEAIQEFKTTLRLNPGYPDALNSLGYLYAEESINLEEAEEMIKQALIYEPNNGAYIDSLGWIYFKQGKYEKATEKLEQAVQFLSDPVIYEHLGDVYLKQHNIIKARENWQKSLEIDSEENPRVIEKLEQHK